MAYIGIDMQTVQPNAGFSALDKGKHVVIIYKSDFKPTSNGAGKKLEMHFKVNGGALNGREAMLNFNWENPSEVAVRIGQGQFRTICDAVGVFPQDTQQLHNIPFLLELDVSPDGKYNEFINAYPLAQSNQAPQQYQPQPVAQPVYQQPTPVMQQPYQPQAQPQPQQFAPQGQANPMTQHQPQYQPQPQVQQAAPSNDVPDWIKNQQAAQAGAAPMGNGQ